MMRPSNAPNVSNLDDAFTWGAPEELDVDPFTGACTYRLPLRIPHGRGNFTPDLALTYNSARRNSPFGWGWQLRVPNISRSVWPAMPKYADAKTYLRSPMMSWFLHCV
jgi:hypothetical protein